MQFWDCRAAALPIRCVQFRNCRSGTVRNACSPFSALARRNIPNVGSAKRDFCRGDSALGDGVGERNLQRWVPREQGSFGVGPARHGAGGIQPADGWPRVSGQDAQRRECRGAQAHARVQGWHPWRTRRSCDVQVRPTPSAAGLPDTPQCLRYTLRQCHPRTTGSLYLDWKSQIKEKVRGWLYAPSSNHNGSFVIWMCRNCREGGREVGQWRGHGNQLTSG